MPQKSYLNLLDFNAPHHPFGHPKGLTKSVGSGEIIIHSGDVMGYGTTEELGDFIILRRFYLLNKIIFSFLYGNVKVILLSKFEVIYLKVS